MSTNGRVFVARITESQMPFACSLTCCWSDGDDGRAVGHHRRRVACYTRQRRRHRERVLGGPREVPSSHPRPRRQVTGSCSPPSSPTGLYARRKRLDPNHKSHFCPRRGEMARPAVLSKRRSTWSRGSGASSLFYCAPLYTRLGIKGLGYAVCISDVKAAVSGHRRS